MPEFPCVVYLNGKWLLHQEARISVFDRGFMLGDGTYEVISFYEGRFFHFEDHIGRLQYSLSQIDLAFDTSVLEKLCEEAVNRNALTDSDGAVYIQITRGIAPRQHAFPASVRPTCLIYAIPVALGDFEKRQVTVKTVPDSRWSRSDIKGISLLPNVLVSEQARKEGVFEYIFVRKGMITEGTHTNIFFVKNNILLTHPADHHVLSGIGRRVVLDLCKELDISFEEKPVSLSELENVQEAFLTGTTTQITSVIKMDDIIFNEGKTGTITRKLQQGLIGLTRPGYFV